MKSSLLAIVVLVVAFSADARAQHGHIGHGHGFGGNGFGGNGLTNGGVIGGGFYGGGFYGGGWGGLQGNNVIPPVNLTDRVPHFALYPPVYYSYPVPRPYGYSPFAYPGAVPTPHAPIAEPQTVVNPYVVGPTQSAAPADSAPQSKAAPAEALPQIKSNLMPRPISTGNKTAQTTAPLRILNPHLGTAVAGN